MTVAFNPLDKHADFTLSSSDTVATFGGTTWRSVRCVDGYTTGNHYFEFEYTTNIIHTMFGVCANTAALTTHLAFDVDGWSINASGGDKFTNGSGTAFYDGSLITGDIIGIAIDMDAGKIWFAVNGTWVDSGDPENGTSPAFDNLSGTVYPAISGYSNGSVVTVLSGDTLIYTAPSGFSPDPDTPVDRNIPAFNNFPKPYNTNFLPGFNPSGLIRQNRKGFSKAF